MLSIHKVLNSVPLVLPEGIEVLTNKIAFLSFPVSFFLFMRLVLNTDNLVDSDVLTANKNLFHIC